MDINLTIDKDIFTVLLLSDTHLYDKRHHLPGSVMNAFRETRPDVILHCGDICTMRLLDEFREIAPVYAVRGNRDIRNWSRLPAGIDLRINCFRIHMEHGQGGLFQYIFTKMVFFLQKILKKDPDYRRAVRIRKNFSDYDLYCFGHSHTRFLDRIGPAILINPGHLNFERPEQEHEQPSFAVIVVDRNAVKISMNIISEGKITSETFSNNSML